ncbi:hypothetical protein [Streptomyces griseosporeus]
MDTMTVDDLADLDACDIYADALPQVIEAKWMRSPLPEAPERPPSIAPASQRAVAQPGLPLVPLDAAIPGPVGFG